MQLPADSGGSIIDVGKKITVELREAKMVHLLRAARGVLRRHEL